MGGFLLIFMAQTAIAQSGLESAKTSSEADFKRLASMSPGRVIEEAVGRQNYQDAVRLQRIRGLGGAGRAQAEYRSDRYVPLPSPGGRYEPTFDNDRAARDPEYAAQKKTVLFPLAENERFTMGVGVQEKRESWRQTQTSHKSRGGFVFVNLNVGGHGNHDSPVARIWPPIGLYSRSSVSAANRGVRVVPQRVYTLPKLLRP